MVTSFNHSGIVVKDLDRVIEFYRDALGLSVVREVDSIAPPGGDHTGIPGARRRLVFVGMPGGGHLLELVHYIDPPSPGGYLDRHQLGAAHVCFNVDDLATLHRRLAGMGIEFVTEPIYKDTPDGGRTGICYARDPEGNWLEFIERRDP
jgi:glyoxylase I family protein